MNSSSLTQSSLRLLQIFPEMQPDFENILYLDSDSFSEPEISEELGKKLKISSDAEDNYVKDEGNAVSGNGGEAADAEEEAAENEEEEEFTFMCGGAGASPTAADDLFINGQIRPIFPLFNRDLLLPGGNSSALYESLPMRPPVKKVFVETRGEDSGKQSTSSFTDGAAGPCCEWSNRKAVEATPAPAPEVCSKSNSTGFSKIWRFKDFLGRSNSDGRDAFVFLNQAAEEKSVKKEKVKGGRVKKGKSKTATVSAHEAYLKSKAKAEERRRPSYLPYRPELMGFFTNVKGGLTKNVHPY